MKKVMCGISCFPDENNKSLAKKISINPSTISTSRQRLNEKELLKKEYVPEFFNMVDGSVVAATGKFRYQFPDDIRESIIGLVVNPAIPFFTASDTISWVVIGILPPKKNELHKEEPSSPSDTYVHDMIFDVNRIWFDSENTEVRRYFDYHNVLCKTLKVDLPQRNYLPSSMWSFDELKKNELKILESLIHDPNLSDFKRSQILGISHPTITKIRKSLNEQGVIKTLIAPNLKALDFSIFAWFNIKLGGKVIEKKLRNMLCAYPNHIFSINDTDNIFLLSTFRDMNDVMAGQQKINSFMSDAGISYNDITFNYFSFENPNFTSKLKPFTATHRLTGVAEGDGIDIVSEDPEQQFTKLLEKFLSVEETSSIALEVKKNLGVGALKGNSTEIVMSMILELLTESKYLFSLRKKERTALQVELIEILNDLQSEVEKQDKLVGKRKTNRILIVEDSEAMRTLLKDIVGEANFNVVGSVDNGEGAIDLYRNLCESNNRPDVVLMDVFLKGLNGVEATRKIKDYDSSACIIVLTSSLDDKIKNEMTTIGVSDYLIKPVTKAQLINSLEQSMTKRWG
jgi:CheY-like chemotaxis protein/DNA-binding MarR family transcriptional regulator